jgi:hypothetical protein
MRYSPLALLLAIIPSTASAQTPAMPVAQRLPSTSQVNADIVVARLMSFDRNEDGRVSSDELTERMRPVVARADTSGDGAIDAAEIRAVAAPAGRKGGSGANYSFGDMVGLPILTRIANAIQDLCLPAAIGEQASRIGEKYAREVEDAAFAKLREAVAPMLTETQLAEFEASVKSPGASLVIVSTSTPGRGPLQEVVVISGVPTLLRRYELPAQQQNAVRAAILAFNGDRQLDDARRSALMMRFEGVLSDAERDDLQAALARRPLVKNTPGRISGFVL